MTLNELRKELNDFLCGTANYIDPVRCGNCIHSRYIPETSQFRCELLRNDLRERKLVRGNDYCSWGDSGEADEE